MINKCIFFLLFIISSSSIGQEIKTNTNTENLHVGEPFTLEFEMEIHPEEELNWITKKDSIRLVRTNKEKSISDSTAFEILGESSFEKEKIQGKTYWKGRYTLIGFEEGWFILPPQKFTFKGKTILSNPKLIILSLLEKKKDLDIYDIEESFEELPSAQKEFVQKTLFWLLILVALIGLAYFILRYIKKTKPATPESDTNTENAKDIALSELTALMEKELWEKEELKMHFTEVSFIVRRYLTKVFDQSFLERTTEETDLILRKKGVDTQKLKPLELILNVADMVKFAKSSVNKEGIFAIYQKTKNFIEEFENR